MDEPILRGSLTSKVRYLEPSQRLILRGGTIIDGLGAVLRDRILVIEGERIADLAPAAELGERSDYEVWDLAGQTILPGLIDLHVHFTGARSFNPYERWLPRNETYRSLVAALDATAMLEAGFTTVRDLGHGPSERAYALREAVETGVLGAPRILTSGWAISQSGGHGKVRLFPPDLVAERWPRSRFADGVEGCRLAVRLNFGDGADLVKIYVDEGGYSYPGHPQIPNFTLEEIRAMADEAHRRGARMAAHATSALGIRNAVLGGADTIEHGNHLADEPDLIQLLVDRGVTLVPTLTQHHRMEHEGPAYGASPGLAAASADALERQLAFLQGAHARGLRVGVGTDLGNTWGHGDSAHELELLVAAGLSPLEAIVAATRVGAEALGLERDLGTLERGKLAELLVVDADPLADITALRRKESIVSILKSRRALR